MNKEDTIDKNRPAKERRQPRKKSFAFLYPQLIVFLFSLVLPVLISGCSDKPKEYNVVLISMDTTRGDHVDTGPGARAFTPELKRFAQKSAVFDHAYCTIPQTLPSHLAILTSHLPHECGVQSNQFIYDGRFQMLQQRLKNNGYSTAACISLGTIDSGTGINTGFDLFLEKLNPPEVFYTTAEKITNEGLRVLNSIKHNKFFLFLHYSDPHTPYAPPSANGQLKIYLDDKPVTVINAHQGSILRQNLPLTAGNHVVRFQLETNLEDFDGFVLRHLKFSENCAPVYQNIEYSKSHYNGSHIIKAMNGTVSGEIRVACKGEGSMKLFQVIPLLTWRAAIDYYRQEVEYMDRHVGRFLRTLEKEKLLDHTIVVITSDHGEGLGERERYFGHVRYLNRQFIEVPLIVYLPGMKPRHFSQPVSHIGIAPTILDFTGIATGTNVRTKSLLTMIKSGNAAASPVYSLAFSPSAVEDKLSVISWPYQCIFSKDGSGTLNKEFYNFTLSQSFRRIDELSPSVVIRNSSKEFQFLQQSYNRLSSAFKNRYFAKMKRSKTEIEKLRTIGYL